jgi:hypothetical protein
MIVESSGLYIVSRLTPTEEINGEKRLFEEYKRCFADAAFNINNVIQTLSLLHAAVAAAAYKLLVI